MLLLLLMSCWPVIEGDECLTRTVSDERAEESRRWLDFQLRFLVFFIRTFRYFYNDNKWTELSGERL